MRGVRCLLVPTTLLAMVDAAIGGKNGVNYHRFKNLVGTIRQPEEVLIDPAFLKTLPRREILCGLAEMFKHGFIADADYLKKLETAVEEGTSLDEFIARSIEIKVAVVTQDETETGLRRILNFGHTVGHALERLDPALAHGEAVAVGMTVAAELSYKRGLITKADADRVRAILSVAGLPVSTDHRAGDIAALLRADKKKTGDSVAFVLLKKIGEAVVVEIPFTELEVTLATVCQHR
jgi:3-dehydroquinate synthase